MKSTTAQRAWTTCSSTVPAITPKKVFSIFLYSFPVHCVSTDIPVLKSRRVGCFVMLLKWRVTYSRPPLALLGLQRPICAFRSPFVNGDGSWRVETQIVSGGGRKRTK